MTTDLEKQFFDTFGIEPDKWCKIGIDKDGNFYKEPTDKRYPQITDRILLELICIIVKYITYLDTIEEFKTVDELKTSILGEVLYQHKQHNRYEVDNTIKQQVQALFKE